MNPNRVYTWEMETSDGAVLAQYDEQGNEQSWKVLPVEKVVRVSLIPSDPALPRHDVVLDLDKGERFVRRFGRGFMRTTNEGIKLGEYLHCVVTNKYRLYVLSSGRCLVTHKDYELYL